MTTRNYILLLTLLATGLSAGAKTPAAAKTEAIPAQPAPPEAALKQAMPAAEVRKIMGEPTAIEPMKEQNGKAEVWVYVREINPTMRHEQVAATPITIDMEDSNGNVRKVQTGENIQFADYHCYTEEKVQLLMFNDHFVVAKITRRNVKELL